MEMKKIVLGYQGSVLSYSEYVAKHINETIKFDINKYGSDIELDEEAINAIWEVLYSECAGDVESLRAYLAKGTDITIGDRDIINHIIELVDDHLNNGVVIKRGHQHIMNLDAFISKAEKLDYVSVVETLTRRLFGYDEDNAPNYLNLILDVLNTTDCDCGEEEYEEE